MKTCQFRDAQPHSTIEGVFCNIDEPQGQYQFNQCHQNHCHLCYSLNNNDIDLNSSSIHKFINGYQTYLNCPVVRI